MAEPKWMIRQRDYARGYNDGRAGRPPAEPIPAKLTVNDSYARGYRQGAAAVDAPLPATD